MLRAADHDLDRAVSLAIEMGTQDHRDGKPGVAALSAAPLSPVDGATAALSLSPDAAALHSMFPDYDPVEVADIMLRCPSLEYAIEVMLGSARLPEQLLPPSASKGPRRGKVSLADVICFVFIIFSIHPVKHTVSP